MPTRRRSHNDDDSAYRRLRAAAGAEWANVAAAAVESHRVRRRVADLVDGGAAGALAGGDCSVVAFGSLARDEFTAGSDVDWTLLVDGQADAGHLRAAQEVGQLLVGAELTGPSSGGAFGEVAFSHPLVHDIGGAHDTNANTTRRLLRMLEAEPVGRGDAFERVLRGVVMRYLADDGAYLTATADAPVKVPRFLLNDLVRFWRTMAVDYACKRRERAGEGWALRNLKLRFSRKLIFAAGLGMAFGCVERLQQTDTERLFGDEPPLEPLAEALFGMARTTPIELVSELIEKHGDAGLAAEVFGPYDEFLAALGDKGVRRGLKGLPESGAAGDENFQRLRGLSHRFGDALLDLFFDSPTLKPLTREYGLF